MSFLNTKTILIKTTIITLLFFTFISYADARRRTYNKEKNRQQAINILRTESEELSGLAGLQPVKIDSSIHKELRDKLLKASESANPETVLSTNLDFEGEYGENLEELAREDDKVVKMDDENFKKLWLDFASADDDDSYELTASGVSKIEMMDAIMEWLGTPYRYGGGTRRGIDCSAFTRTVYKETAKIMLPRTARTQINSGQKISRSDLEFGDLIFFHTRRRPYVSHVGIYLGDNLFAHASSRYGVTIGSLESTYYKKRFIQGTRFNTKDVQRMSLNKKKVKSASAKK